jgi:hypothetical protein
MHDWMKEFYTFLVAAIGQAVITCVVIAMRAAAGPFPVTIINPTSNPVLSVSLAVGCVMLFVILAKFTGKYLKHPSLARLNTLIAIISFIIADTTYFLNETFTFSPHGDINRALNDSTNVFFIVGVFMFLLFGISFFLTAANEKTIKTLKRVLNTALVILYATLLVFKLITFNGVDSIGLTLLGNGIEYAIFAFGGVCLVLLIFVAFRAVRISRTTTEPAYKKGLTSLGVSYFILSVAIIVQIIGILVSRSDKTLNVVAIVLIGITFYFIYEGFVKPTAQQAS